jgi:AAA domain
MESKIILCLGPVCSGKTTWSKNFIKENPEYIRFSFDEFRLMCFGSLKGNLIDKRFMGTINNNIVQVGILFKRLIIDGYPLDAKAMSGFIHSAFDVEIKLFDVTTVDSLTRNRNRKQEGGHFLDSNELLRYNKLYREFVKSEAFKSLVYDKQGVTVSATEFLDVNLELIGEK